MKIIDLVTEKLAENTELKTFGKGTTKIISVNETNIVYQRGKSRFYLKTRDFDDTYTKYAGTTCSTSDLKKYNTKVFGKDGHSCNATLFFQILKFLDLAEINGDGVRNNPYYGFIKKIDFNG